VSRPARRIARRLWEGWRTHTGVPWRRVRDSVLLILVPSVLVLGTIGFERLSTEDYGFLDSFYRAITLFTFGGAVDPPLPATLQIARIIAPLLTGYAALGAVLVLFRDRARAVGVWACFDEHVIVAGLGARGARLAAALRAADVPVVIIERDRGNAEIEIAQAQGSIVVSGDAGDPAVLRRAGLDRASHLVVLCGSDGTNVDVAAVTGQEFQRQGRRLPTFVHVDDVALWHVLSTDAAHFNPYTAVRLELFNVYGLASRLMFERHQPFAFADPSGSRRPHVLVVGLEGVGEQLVLHVARFWQASDPASDELLRITLAGDHAMDNLACLHERYPALERVCTVDARHGGIGSDWFQRGGAATSDTGECDVTYAYVCLDDESSALSAALALHAAPGGLDVPVVVALDDDAKGVAAILAGETGRFGAIKPFGVLTSALSPTLLVSGTNELIARAKHLEYLAHERAKGVTVADNPLLVPWDELVGRYAESNRQFADSVGEKLKDAGCVVVPMPLRDDKIAPFELAADMIEHLAEREHERWMTAMIDDGWRHGERSDTLKTHPDLRPWDELDEDARDKDRNPIRQLPRILELTGFRIQSGDTPRPTVTLPRAVIK
jgi:hypothetical protein